MFLKQENRKCKRIYVQIPGFRKIKAVYIHMEEREVDYRCQQCLSLRQGDYQKFYSLSFFDFLENMCYCKQEKKVNKNIIERRPRHDS